MRRPSRVLVAAAVAAMSVAGCGEDDPTVAVEEATDETGGTVDEDVEVEDDPVDDPTDEPADEPADDANEEPATDGTDGTDGSGDDGEPVDGDGTAAPSGPAPDAEEVDEPCAAHEDRTMDNFIAVVAPVDEQVVTDRTVDLVGCSNVFEATVSYRVLDADGATLDEGFTTAECGNGCVGAFRDELDLSPADGEATVELEVFSESPQDGSDTALTTVTIVLG